MTRRPFSGSYKMDKKALIEMTAEIVASHASLNAMSQEDLLGEIGQVFQKLSSLTDGTEMVLEEAKTAEQDAVPSAAVPLEAAFGADKVFCMVCGKGMKTLKRHLSTAHGLKPGQYRKQYNIPAGTPLVAKNYSEARKKMAQKLNLAERLVKARAARKKKRAASGK
jgi:predicted transcriptional regulator